MTTLGLALSLVAPPLISQAQPTPIPVPHLDPAKVFAMMANPTGSVTQGSLALVLAHRGIHQEPGCAENSYCSIKAAYEAGADGVELDVKLAKPVFPDVLGPTLLGHDNTLDREISAGGSLGPFNMGPFPLNDPYYRDLSKLPFLYTFDNRDNPNNRKRDTLDASYLKSRILNDQFDKATTDNQIGVGDALAYIANNDYNMMIWLDVKNVDSLKSSIRDINSVRIAKPTKRVLDNVGLKLGWKVVRDTTNPNTIYQFETTGLYYLLVFGTGDLADMAAWGDLNGGNPGWPFATRVNYAVDKLCQTANKCLGAELSHKYPDAPTKGVFDHVRNKPGRPWQIAGFHTVPQYEWYTYGLAAEHRSTTYGRWYPRTDGSCCFSPTDTLNNVPGSGIASPLVETSESHDLRPSYRWNTQTYSFITTDDPRRVLRELQSSGKRDPNVVWQLGGDASIPSGGATGHFGIIPDGLYFIGSVPSSMLKATGTGAAFSSASLDCVSCIWYIRNYQNQKYTISSVSTGTSRVLSYDANSYNLVLGTLINSPFQLWNFNINGDQINMVSNGKVLTASLTPLRPALPELATTGGPPGFAFCADGLDPGVSPAGPTYACDTRGPATVAYGAGDKWIYKNFASGPVQCTLSNFGFDPAQGVLKACFFAPRALRNATTSGLSSDFLNSPCASEGQVCAAQMQTRVVAFGDASASAGSNGGVAYARIPVGTSFTCDVTLVGFDPAPGRVKSCYYSNANVVVDNGPPGYVPCALELAICTFSGTAQVAFGGIGPNDPFNGSNYFTYKTLSGGAVCQPITFGVLPAANNVTARCYYKAMGPPRMDAFGAICAQENSLCFVGNTPAIVAYGNGSQWTFKSGLTGYVNCNDATFGYPLLSGPKSCQFVRTDWRVCASDGLQCNGLPAGSVVAYGIPSGVSPGLPSAMAYRPVLNGGSIACSPSFFGADPAPNVVKSCFYDTLSLSELPPAGYTWCAAQGGTCLIGANQSAQIAYGGLGQFVYKPSHTGNFSCAGTSLEGNPDPLPQVVKACYYRLY